MKKENAVLEVTGLRKRYGSVDAVKELSFSVSRGEIFGLLGHNGAGKTTTVECALGVKSRDAGRVSILGMDPGRDRKRLFARVGVQFQDTRFQDKIRVREACEQASALYPRTRPWAEILERLGLSGKERSFARDLSGGERQKLAVALALLPDPELVFLDELTTGLDPAARRETWRFLAELKAAGTTIVLTSHFMDEVEFLCDRVAIMRSGTFACEGSPSELVAAHGDRNLEDVFLRYGGKEAI